MSKKSRNLLLVCICILICFSFILFPANAVELQTDDVCYTVDTPYSYPISPGSAEWAALNSLEEKIEACAVDEDLLESMTTPALLETVINYPLLINIYAFNSIDQGFASVSKYFKGIDILLNRKDTSDYIQLALQTETYSVNDTDDIVREGYLQSLARFMSRTQGPSRISTPGGSTLEDVIYNATWKHHGFTEAQAQANHDRLARAYPNAIEVSGISPSYNCHSYAWYDTSPTNNCWINNPNPYLYDGSYTRQSTASVGYRVAWSDEPERPGIPAHSAIVHSNDGTIKYISKWGFNGVFIHSLNDCPYSGDVSYWN